MQNAIFRNMIIRGGVSGRFVLFVFGERQYNEIIFNYGGGISLFEVTNITFLPLQPSYRAYP